MNPSIGFLDENLPSGPLWGTLARAGLQCRRPAPVGRGALPSTSLCRPRLLRGQFPCKALGDQDLEVVPPVPYKNETGRRRGATGALACGGYRAAD